LTPAQIFLISKRLGHPWADATKKLILELAEGLPEFRFGAMIDRTSQFPVNSSIHPVRLSGKMPDLIAIMKPSNAKKILNEISRACLLHFFSAPSIKSALLGRLVTALYPQSPSIHTITSFPRELKYSRFICFSREIVCLSEDAQQYFQQLFHRPAHRIYPGISEPKTPDTRKFEELLFPSGSKDRFVLLYPGDLHFSGCAPFLTETLPRLFARHPGVLWVFATRIKSTEDMKIRTKFLQLQNLFPQNILLVDSIEYLPDLMVHSDCVVFPVQSMFAKMDIPISLLEAMSLKIPIVVSDFAPLIEVVGGNQNFFFKRGSSDDFLDRIDFFYRSEAERNSAGKFLYRRFQSCFERECMIAQYRELYSGLMQERM
jgi:glycosyltransferase involved in cell wall biosynthesis